MTSTFTWHSQVWFDSATDLNQNGTQRQTYLTVPLDESLQRIIYHRHSWGSLDRDDPQQVPKPAVGDISTVFDVYYTNDPPINVWEQWRPMVYGGGWTLVQSLDNKIYWTWTQQSALDFDIELRRAPAVESAHELLLEVNEYCSFSDLGNGLDRAFPTGYQSRSKARWLTSKAS